MKLPVVVVLSNLLFVSGLGQETVSTIPSQDEFFRAISELCGKANSGTVTVDNSFRVNPFERTLPKMLES